MSKNTGDGELDKYLNGLVRVKLDDKQKGHMLAKLSAKDKTAIQKWAAQEANKANKQGFYAAMGMCGIEHSKVPTYYIMYREALNDPVIQNKLEGLS